MGLFPHIVRSLEFWFTSWLPMYEADIEVKVSMVIWFICSELFSQTNKQTKQNITRLTGHLIPNTNAFTRPGKWWWKQRHKRYKQMAGEKWLKSWKTAQWLRCPCKGLEFIPSSHIRWLQLSVPPATGDSMPPSGLWGNAHPCELLKLEWGNPVIVIHCEACHSSGKAKTNVKT